MSWVARLFRGAPPAISATAVTIDPDVARALTADGTPLERAVDAALRRDIAAAAAPATAPAQQEDGAAIPFWIAREEEQEGRAGSAESHADIEDELRDRIAHRRPETG